MALHFVDAKEVEGFLLFTLLGDVGFKFERYMQDLYSAKTGKRVPFWKLRLLVDGLNDVKSFYFNPGDLAGGVAATLATLEELAEESEQAMTCLNIFNEFAYETGEFTKEDIAKISSILES